jgi:tetratricopeptide (TPR) repeat protein
VALSLDRNSGLALYAAADLAGVLGRWGEAETLFQNALSIDPLDADTRAELCFTLYRAGRFAGAEAECRRVLGIRPSYVQAQYSLALPLLARGQTQAALHEMQQEALEGGQPSGLAIVYYALGRKADSDAARSRAERDVATQGPFTIASIHAIPGESNAALHWLERAYAEKNYSLQYIKGDWRFSSLQKDARYKALLKKMNLPPE